MKLARSKNAIRNAYFGLIEKLITIIFPFIVRTIFIHTLGAEYLGLNSLFTSILTVLNLTELGFSSAIVYSMYKPIAQDDADTINALLYFYKKVYRYIGLIILGIGILLIPFLPNLVSGTYPEGINLVYVYLIYLINTVLSYWMFAYLSSIINAHQRNDLISRVNIIISLAMYTCQTIVLLTVKNYYIYILILPAFTIINNLRTAIIAKKMFPQYKAKGKLSKEVKADIKEKVSGLMINKVCQVSRNAFDSIFISMFLGLTETAMYNNYYYIMNSIVAIMTVLTNSVTAGAGNSVSMESPEKNYNDMNRLNFAYMWLSGWFTVCLLCLYQPFMKIWVGENLMFPFAVVILICLYFYVLKMGDIRYIYVQAKGIWWENRFRAIAESIANLVLNYFLGKYFGVYGIIAATLISLFLINFCYGSQIIFKHYFTKQKISDYFGRNAIYALVTLVAASITYFLCTLITFDSLIGFIIKIAVCIVVPNIIYFLIYFKTKQFKESIPWLLDKFKFKSKKF
jgi:O-antigen/teichoic acid export membrane protein